MIVLTFFTSRISHFNHDIFMVIIFFQICSLGLGVRKIDNASLFSYDFWIQDHPDSITEPWDSDACHHTWIYACLFQARQLCIPKNCYLFCLHGFSKWYYIWWSHSNAYLNKHCLIFQECLLLFLIFTSPAITCSLASLLNSLYFCPRQDGKIADHWQYTIK